MNTYTKNSNIENLSFNNIMIFVDNGSFTKPFFNFYNDSKELIKDLKINVSNTYTFKRLNAVSSNPLYISDNGYELQSNFIELTGHGSLDKAIKGIKKFILNFRSQVYFLEITNFIITVPLTII